MFRIYVLMTLTFTTVNLASFGFAQDTVYSPYQFSVPTGFLRKYTAKVSVERKGSGGVPGKSLVSFDYTVTFRLKVEKPSPDRSAKGLTPPNLREKDKKKEKAGDEGGNRRNVSNAANRQVDLLFINNAVKIHKVEFKNDLYKPSPSHAKPNDVSRFGM